jgi:ketol-acid reductoisomerase
VRSSACATFGVERAYRGTSVRLIDAWSISGGTARIGVLATTFGARAIDIDAAGIDLDVVEAPFRK